MTAANDKVIEKLKKLFALGQSSNEHEAKLAMQKANEIMTEYQISASDIDLSEEGAVTTDEIVLDGGKRSLWLCLLADKVAKLYDARCTYIRKKDDKGLRLCFYGTKADILASQMTFNHLLASWKSISRLALVTATKEADSFAPGIDVRVFNSSHGYGFTKAIGHRIDELIRERQAKVKTSTGRDLVVVKGQLVKDFMATNANLRMKRIGGKSDNRGYDAGYASGKAIPLHGAISDDKPLMISKG